MKNAGDQLALTSVADERSWRSSDRRASLVATL